MVRVRGLLADLLEDYLFVQVVGDDQSEGRGGGLHVVLEIWRLQEPGEVHQRDARHTVPVPGHVPRVQGHPYSQKCKVAGVPVVELQKVSEPAHQRFEEQHGRHLRGYDDEDAVTTIFTVEITQDQARFLKGVGDRAVQPLAEVDLVFVGTPGISESADVEGDDCGVDRQSCGRRCWMAGGAPGTLTVGSATC